MIDYLALGTDDTDVALHCQALRAMLSPMKEFGQVLSFYILCFIFNGIWIIFSMKYIALALWRVGD